MGVGSDDRNEGAGEGECPEHAWVLVEAVVGGRGGAFVEKACTRCGAVVLVGPDELGGWV